MGHKRIPGRCSQGREPSERLSWRPAYPLPGGSPLERKGLVIGSIGVVVGLVVLSMSNAVTARIDFSKPLVIGFAAGDDWEPDVAADGSGNVKNGPTDKVGLAVRDSDVYVSYSVAQKFFVASSHDGGKTFASVQVNHETSTYGWTLTSGGAVDTHGTVYFSWVGIKQSGNALGLQDLFVTKSSDGGQSWTTSYAERGMPPGPEWKNCCGWDFWGPQVVVTVDASDRVYVLYNAGTRDNGPPIVWYRSSSDGGASWSTRVAIHSSIGSAWALFPAIEGGKAGEGHTAWVDNRPGQENMWYRTSTDSAVTCEREIQVSQFAAGFPYKTADGFAFPYGDYDAIAWDGTHVHLAWGEGPSYHGPGNIWYATS